MVVVADTDCEVPRLLVHIFSEQQLDFHPALADSMSFEPVEFCFSNRTILKANSRYPLEFAPVTSSVKADEPRKDTNPSTSGNRFDLVDLAENLESHKMEDTLSEDRHAGSNCKANGRAGLDEL
jgi:hypothetical protein